MVKHLLLTAISFLLTGILPAQNCDYHFVSRQFGVHTERDVLYGIDTLFNGGADSLRMNIFKPLGDGQTERPLLIALHGGAWIGGHRNDMDSLCYGYAQRGYVAATISYRMGFYGPWPFQPPYANDPAEVIRACYRAVQDLNGAIRFLKGRGLQDSSSAEQVFLLGGSAGAITAVHSAYVNDPAEKPAECGAIGPVMEFLTPRQRPDLGPVEGRLNFNGHDNSVKAVASLFGGIFDTTYIDAATDPALYLYHQTGDRLVGCGYQQGLWGLPLGLGANYPWFHGSCSMDPRMQNLGYDSTRYQFYLHDGPDHTVHDLPLVDSLIAVFFAQQICPAVSTGTGPDDITASDIRVQPNPASGTFYISWTGAPFTRILLFDLSGRLIREEAVSAGDTEMKFRVDHLPNGLYILRCEGVEAFSTTRVVVAR